MFIEEYQRKGIVHSLIFSFTSLNDKNFQRFAIPSVEKQLLYQCSNISCQSNRKTNVFKSIQFKFLSKVIFLQLSIDVQRKLVEVAHLLPNNVQDTTFICIKNKSIEFIKAQKL